MKESISRNLALVIILFSLFPLVYSMHLRNISFAQEKALEGGWISKSQLPTPRTEVTSTNLDDDIYVIGGFISNGETTATVEMYNATSDSWKTDIAPLPIPL